MRVSQQEGRSAAAPTFVRRHQPDYRIVLYMGLLMLIGMVVMYAIGPQRANVLNNAYGTDYYTSTYFFIKQAASIGLSFAAFVAMAMIPYQKIQHYAGRILLVGLGLCALLFLAGNVLHIDKIATNTLGAYRWFNLGPLGSVQPAEFLKFGLLIFCAGFLGTRVQQRMINDRDKTLLPIGLIILLVVGLVIGLQKDMGTGIVEVAIVACMMLVAGVSRRVGLFLLAGIVAIGVVFIVIAPHRIERVTTFFGGDSGQGAISKGNNYQVDNAKLAIGTGGLTGVGIGNSVEATGYLPEAINDSVFAIMGETFGFLGLVGILALFTALLLRLLKVADHLVDIRLRLIVAGTFGWLAAHVALNVAAMIGIFPLTGITLPMLSFGGTSMIFIAGALGLVFQLSRYTVFGSKLEEQYETNEDTSSRRRIGRARYAGRRRHQSAP